MIKIAKYLSVLLFSLVLSGQAKDTPVYVLVAMPVTADSFNHAALLCSKYIGENEEMAKRVNVMLTGVKGETYIVPCFNVITARK